MKRITLQSYIIMSVPISLFFFSCKKPNDSQSASSFTWTYSGTHYTANIDTAYLYSMAVGPIIIAGTGTNIASAGTGPSISLNSFFVGTYSLGSGSSNLFAYVDANGDMLYGDIVTLNITASSNSRLSGNFSGNVKNSNNFSFPITGSFANVPVRN